MSNPVFNLNSPLVNKLGKIIPPWNSFFQQFTQNAPAVNTLNLTGSPFSYTPNAKGNLIISNGAVSAITLIRGIIFISLSITRPVIIPMSIGDTVQVIYTVAPTIQFLGD